MIFEHLDPVTSTCLGLTCKRFYAIHRAIHGSVPLKSSILIVPLYRLSYDIANTQYGLWRLLQDWVPFGMQFCWRKDKFFSHEEFYNTYYQEHQPHLDEMESRLAIQRAIQSSDSGMTGGYRINARVGGQLSVGNGQVETGTNSGKNHNDRLTRICNDFSALRKGMRNLIGKTWKR